MRLSELNKILINLLKMRKTPKTKEDIIPTKKTAVKKAAKKKAVKKAVKKKSSKKAPKVVAWTTSPRLKKKVVKKAAKKK